MEFYRAYAQPSLPGADHFRVFGFDVAGDVNIEYSKALKDACRAMAGPKPSRPTHCPRCGIANAIFTSNVCYKAGVAGAWNMICLSCHKVHFPCQPGPTAEGLEQIEAIRARDQEAFLERKTKKAKQRAKARAKPRKEDTDDEPTVLAAAGTPFGNINNAVELLVSDNLKHANSLSGARGSGKMKAREMDIKPLPPMAKNYQMKSSNVKADNAECAGDNLRTVQLVFWAQDQEPHVEQVPVQFEYELFLYEFTLFKIMRGPCAFERYSFEASLWCDLPWNTSPIHVAPEDDVIFVRSWGVRCRGFGHQLARYQRMHGLSLSPASGIRATVNIPPARHHWLVVWGAHQAAPEIHLVDLSILRDLDDEARLALPWAHLIADAPFLLIWRETETAWAAVAAGISSGVLEAPLTLVAHPSAESLVGSGEAIAWLEDWRMGGGPRSRAGTPTGCKAGPSKRAHQRSGSGSALSAAHAGGKRKLESMTAPVASTLVKEGRVSPSVEGLLPSPSVFPVANNAEPKSGSGSSGHPDLARTLNQPESSASTGDMGLVEAPQALRPTCVSGGLNHARDSSGVRDVASASIRRTTPDSEVNIGIVEGPRIPSLVAPVTKQIAHKDGTHLNAGSVDARKVRASSTPIGDVEMVDGLRGQPLFAPCARSRGVAPPPDRRASPPSHNNVEIVEGPHAPVLMDDRLKDESGPRHGRHATNAPNHPALPDDLRIVVGREAPQAPPPTIAIARNERLECEKHASAGSEGAFERRASTDHDSDVQFVDDAHAHNIHSVAGRQPARPPRRNATPASDNDVEIVEGPVPPPVGLVTQHEGLNSKTPSAAGSKAATKRPASPSSDDDIVLIDQPSAELRRSFKKKARSSAASSPYAKGPGPSTGNTSRRHSSDDEVEFVDNASIVPKRRVSSVNGKQVIDMT